MAAKYWLRSKTIIFNVLVAVFAVLSEQSEALRPFLSGGGYVVLMLIVSAVNTYLRSVTTTRLRGKDERT